MTTKAAAIVAPLESSTRFEVITSPTNAPRYAIRAVGTRPSWSPTGIFGDYKRKRDALNRADELNRAEAAKEGYRPVWIRFNGRPHGAIGRFDDYAVRVTVRVDPAATDAIAVMIMIAALNGAGYEVNHLLGWGADREAAFVPLE